MESHPPTVAELAEATCELEAEEVEALEAAEVELDRGQSVSGAELIARLRMG